MRFLVRILLDPLTCYRVKLVKRKNRPGRRFFEGSEGWHQLNQVTAPKREAATLNPLQFSGP